jgi:hypothetical protein
MIDLLLQGGHKRGTRRLTDLAQRRARTQIDFAVFILAVKIAQSIEQGRNSLDTFRVTKGDDCITADTPGGMLKLLDEFGNSGVVSTRR